MSHDPATSPATGTRYIQPTQVHTVQGLRKCFVSYHPDDEGLAAKFIAQFDSETLRLRCRHASALHLPSLDFGQPEAALKVFRNHHLGDSTTVIVLLSDRTYRSQSVDWEIAAGILDAEGSRRCALVAITLPEMREQIKRVPARFRDNWSGETGYGRWFKFPATPKHLDRMLLIADRLRLDERLVVKNSRPLMSSDLAESPVQS